MSITLRGAMGKHKITIAEVARVARISTQSLHNKLTGKTDYKLTEMARILNYFNTLSSATYTIEDLFFEQSVLNNGQNSEGR